MVDLIVFTIEIAFLILVILSIIPQIKSWKSTKNRIYIAILSYMVTLVPISIFRMMSFLVNIDANIKILGTFTIGIAIAFLLMTVQLEFILYLGKYVKLYTLPLFIDFYLILALMLGNSTTSFIIFAILVSWILPIFLIYEGKKKRNGLAVGMGLFFIVYGLSQMTSTPLVIQVIRLIAMICLYLSTRVLFEKYFFLTKEEEDKIQATWISKLVVKS